MKIDRGLFEKFFLQNKYEKIIMEKKNQFGHPLQLKTDNLGQMKLANEMQHICRMHDLNSQPSKTFHFYCRANKKNDPLL